MKPLRRQLDRLHPHFAEKGKLHKLYPLYEALDTFLYTPGETTIDGCHVRDSLDLKRMMSIVVLALAPCMLMACWNTGYQSNTALESLGAYSSGSLQADNWRANLLQGVGIGLDSNSFLSNFLLGALYFVPVYLVTMIVGGTLEVIFSIVRRHEVNEGFLVTGALFPLTLPPSIPLWQVALGIAFGVVFGKEIFGGTGKNFLNPALTARAFLYFAYPAYMSGDAVWTALPLSPESMTQIDGYSGPTPLGIAAIAPIPGDPMEVVASEHGMSWWDAFLGVLPGSLGETSALACILGAVVLIASGIGSWRIMLSCVLGAVGMSAFFWMLGSETNPMFAMPPWWHLVVGGFAFGAVFMATDPVSAAFTETGKWFYGVLIGALTVLIRVINPAYPEGIMLAILFANVMAPLIDYGVLQSTIKRRMARYAA